MLDFLKKKKAPTWKSLDSKTKSRVVKKILNLAGPHYKVAQGFNVSQRELGIPES